MPRIRGSTQTIAPLVREDLVAKLVQVLTDESQQAGPVVFEIPIQDTDTVHVIVVWEKWGNLSPENRTSIIREAYEQFDERVAEDQRMSPKITLILGVTNDEALNDNLLPYALFPHQRQIGPLLPEVEKAMMAVGAIKTKQGIRLAFPTRQMRNDVEKKIVEFTQKNLPDVSWFPVDLQEGVVDD